MSRTPPPDDADPRPDGVLIDAARRGDRRALEALLRRHHDPIHRLCRRMCTDRGDAEDATQDALVALVRGLAGYDGRSRFSTWVYRVATNACLDQLRRRARRPLPTDALTLGAAESPSFELSAAGAPRHAPVGDPADAVVGSEQRATLSAALAELPEDFRVPVLLRDVADLDYAEIAAVLDLPPGTVRSRISRGRARLAELLAEPSSTGTAEPNTTAEPSSTAVPNSTEPDEDGERQRGRR